MKAVLVTLSALLALAACGSDDGGSYVADDPSAEGSVRASAPAVPLPEGEVSTTGLVTVMDDPQRDGPEVCFGPVAESYPPMCSGPALLDWDWDGLGRGMHETQGEQRWGSYALTGTWDGEAFTAVSAVPAALYDAVPAPAAPVPTPTSPYDDDRLADIAAELVDQLPGALGATAISPQVLLEVYYDDGTLQDWVDETYGAGVVVVQSALVDASA